MAVEIYNDLATIRFIQNGFVSNLNKYGIGFIEAKDQLVVSYFSNENHIRLTPSEVIVPVNSGVSDLRLKLLEMLDSNIQFDQEAITNISIDADSVNLNTDGLEDLVNETNLILTDQVTQLNNIETMLGDPPDDEATSDTGTFSLVALFKRLLTKLTSNFGTDGSTPPVIPGTGIRGWLRSIYDTVVSTIGDFLEFGSANNIPFALNSEIIFDVSRYSSVGFHLIPPAGGKIQFEGSFDGTNYTPITIREIGSNGYTQTTSITEDYLGSVSCLKTIKFKVIVAGASNGTVIGKFNKVVSTLEGIEHSSAPHLFGFEIKYTSFDFTQAQLNTSILTPTPGTRFVLTDIIFTSDSLNNITIFDETNVAGNTIIKVKTGQERFFSHAFKGVIKSKVLNNSLRTTSDSAGDFRGTLVYYEINQ